MARYIPYDYHQNIFVAINFQDQLQPGTQTGGRVYESMLTPRIDRHGLSPSFARQINK